VSVLATYGHGKCAVCRGSCRRGFLMCSKDWKQVPRPLQDAVWVALARWERGDITLGELRGAQDAAVEAVRGV
jgi:hypothetical protein